eukprot:CAMPEP_0114555368 /NCGR_PEP_ID=MMETSP0114-20121206/8713_1 /TAXON_ID=31324 /ORGANISM="Goniomonas sp, Strain m" /LENGTH=396 /DNA_ID=CAMNT_0001740491 /DNA_START=25 /DNA_END=1215 /DNA_ORIENTATION=+
MENLDALPLFDDILRSDLYCNQQEQPLAFGLSQCAAQFGFDFPLDFSAPLVEEYAAPSFFPASPELCPASPENFQASPEYFHSPVSYSSVEESPERRCDSPVSEFDQVDEWVENHVSPATSGTEPTACDNISSCSSTPTMPAARSSCGFSPTSPASSDKVRISTQTAVFELNQTVDLLMLARLFPGSIIYDPANTAFESARGKKQSFQNQASTQVRVAGHSVSVNIFKNGRVKLAGSKGQVESHMLASHIVSLVGRSCGPCGSAVADPASLSYSGFRVVMNKAEFEVPFPVNLVRAQSVLTAAGFAARYNPESYCGLVVPVPNPDGGKDVSAMIFASGKAFVTGNCDEASVGGAFQEVRNVLEANLGAVQGSEPLSSRKRKTTAAVGRVSKRATTA